MKAIFTFSLVDLTKRDLEEYYSGFADRALWPLLHYRLDLPLELSSPVLTAVS